MTGRILYIYAEPREGFPNQYYNMTALVVDGKKVDTSAGLNEERIYVMAKSAVDNKTQIILDEHPKGEELNAKLDGKLSTKLKEITGGN